MSPLARARALLRPLVRPRDAEADLDDELRFHLEMEAARHAARGLAPQEARRAAVLAFGGVEKVREECREARRLHWVETLGQDLRYGLRTLLASPGYAAAAVLTLALGLGANAAVFTVVHRVLLRPLPYLGGDRLVVLRQEAPLAGIEDAGFSVPEILDYRAGNGTLDGLVEYHRMSFHLLGRGEPWRVATGVVSAEFFDVLGVPPLLGRTFEAADEAHGAEPVLVLSHRFWREQLGGDPAVVGATFEMNDRVHAVVGVLPPVPQFPHENDVYMPTTACPYRSSPETVSRRGRRGYLLIGRLREGVSASAAEADLGTVARRLADEYPEFYPRDVGHRVRALPLREELVRTARPTLLLLLGTVGLVLVIAGANAGNLTLARALARRQEFALRSALGAGGGRLLRQLVVESTLLALAAGAVGVVFAAAGADLLRAFTARFTPRAVEVALDGWVLAFVVVLALGMGLALGGLAAFRATRARPASGAAREGRAGGGPGRERLRAALVVSQVATSVVLLAAAGLTLRSLVALQRVDPGFEPENVLSASFELDWSAYDEDPPTREAVTRILEGVAALPGVTAAAVASEMPLGANRLGSARLAIEGRPEPEGRQRPQVEVRWVSPAYFTALGIPLLEGRSFTGDDHAEAPAVAMVNRSVARHLWGAGSPLGERVSVDGGAFRRVVGVVGDVRQYGLASEPRDEVYLAFPQVTDTSWRLLVRGAVPPATLARQIRRVVWAVAPETPVADVETLERVRSASLASPRTTALLLGLFAALALGITAAGIAGLLAYFVAQRRHEIGVRMALGAERGSVLALVVRRGTALVAAGLALGLAVGLLLADSLAGVLSQVLFAVEPTDPRTFAAVVALLLGVAALACLVPARRATAIDPAEALRND